MGGFFGAISKRDVTLDIFFGVDYHSHLGTRRGGMVIHDSQDGFQREIHSIENSPFRTKFEADLNDFHGTSGIGCISASDPQPLLVRSHLGLFAITTVGIINNAEELVEQYNMESGHQFMAMSSGQVNSTELTAALINQKDDLVSGIRHAQQGFILKHLPAVKQRHQQKADEKLVPQEPLQLIEINPFQGSNPPPSGRRRRESPHR